jgi:hypothetical protein
VDECKPLIRGDRGGANSAVNTRGRVDAGEKNAAEAQLNKAGGGLENKHSTDVEYPPPPSGGHALYEHSL